MTKIFKYGARSPIANADLVQTQLRLATDYQRVLTLLQIRKKEVVERMYRQACPREYAAYMAAEQEIEKAVLIVRAQRSRPGDMLEPDEETKFEDRVAAKSAKAALVTARGVRTETRNAWFAARKAVTPRLKRRIQMCVRGVYARSKAVYGRASAVGLAWGTRLKVSEFVERAMESTVKSGARMNLPRFDGSGTLAVQLQNGLDPKEALSNKDTRFRIEMVDASRWHAAQGKNTLTNKKGIGLPQPDPNSRRSQKNGYAIAHLRIGSDGRKPIWASWPIVLHRPLPAGAAIKWAQAHAVRIGARTEWSILVTIDDETPTIKPTDGPGGKVLAVNLGWRNLLDDNIRVGYAVGNDGHEEEIQVPRAFVTKIEHVSSLQGIRSKMLDNMKAVIGELREDGACPEWFMAATRHTWAWRAQRKVVRLISNWKRERFPGDERTFDLALAWQKQDRHLWFWECDEREKAARMRKDFYRCVAARWATKYSRIAVTAMDLRDFVEHVPVEEGADTKDREQRATQRMASPSEFRNAIKNACASRGCAYEEIEAHYLTQTCHACQVTMAFPARTFLVNTCTACGLEWDQDYNHSRNLLALAGGSTKAPKAKSNRWKKKKELKIAATAAAEAAAAAVAAEKAVG